MSETKPMVLSARPMGQSEWAIMREQAAVLVTTGFLPTAIKTPEQALAIMLKAREINVPPLYGLSNIAVIQGKPTCNSELMAALIYRDHGDGALEVEVSDDQACAILYKRKSWTEAKQFVFTLQDAQRADLLKNPTWQKYPAAMLRARCMSAVARMAFPDSIGGMYTPEELGATVTVTDDGEVIESGDGAGTSSEHRPSVPTLPAVPEASPRTGPPSPQILSVPVMMFDDPVPSGEGVSAVNPGIPRHPVPEGHGGRQREGSSPAGILGKKLTLLEHISDARKTIGYTEAATVLLCKNLLGRVLKKIPDDLGTLEIGELEKLYNELRGIELSASAAASSTSPGGKKR